MQEGAHTLRSLTLFVSSHFMFNVLGKLQSEILNGEKREAVSTLGLYSKLIRQACSIALKERITLAEEGLFLENYLKLEKERFKESPFDYKLSGFDSDSFLIVPFIIQPFVELALLGSLGNMKNTISVDFDEINKRISIDSVMLNMEIHEKLADKCETAKQRIEFYKYIYKVSESNLNYKQEIIL